eukprot:6954512-Prymnesium_polylepis.1
MARHRLRRVCYVGASHRPRAMQASEGPRGDFAHDSPADFAAYVMRGARGLAGLSARRGAPRRR